MTVQPILNLEDRMRRYRSECFRVYAGELPAMFLLFLCLSLALFFAMNKYLGPLDYDWRLCALAFAVVIEILPVVMFKPKRPTQEDVLRDQALRREYGLDDTVRK